MNHTPGPWKWDGNDLWHIGVSYEDEKDPHLYTGINKDTQLSHSLTLKANARLIAAAPELAKSLEDAGDALRNQNYPCEVRITQALIYMDEAIRKARE